MEFFIKLLLLSTLISQTICETRLNKPPVTIARTELKVSRSLNPEDTQTVKVMTRDGNIAQLIVKKRDAKAKVAETPTIYTNWIPITSVVWSQHQPLNQGRSGSNFEATTLKSSNVIDSDRIPNIPAPVNIRSDNVYVKNTNVKVAKKSRSVMLHSSEDGNINRATIPIIHGVRVPDDEMDKRGKTWRNARVINGELYPYEDGYKPPAAIPVGELIYANNPSKHYHQSSIDNVGAGPFSKEDNFKNTNTQTESVGPFTVQDNQQQSLYQSGGPFTKEDNINLSNSKLVDYIKEINDREAKRDYYTARRYRNLRGVYAEPLMEKRMLTNQAGYHSYPNSLMYTPTATKLSPVNFNEGVRTPVLQYAHPELGVQPARVGSPPSSTEEATKVHANYYDYTNNNEQLKPTRNVDIGRQHQQTQNSVEYYKKDVLNYPYGGYYIKPKQEQPFWMKITESIKDNVQNGFERMQQMTRPVFEPLVEATHKISYNLGLSGNKRHPNQFAEKKLDILGPIAAVAGGGGHILLPALGLVAGGAALGLGAAAVGRFLEPAEMRALNQQQEFIMLLNEAHAKHHGVRQRRSIADNVIRQGVDLESHLEHLTAPNLWSDTPCSKKLFCDVMIKQSEENVVFMEKKMNILLNMVSNPEIMSSVSHHLEDVMDAVHSKDCSRFQCLGVHLPTPPPNTS